MKPIFAKENGRCALQDQRDKNGYIHCMSFIVKFSGAEQSHSLNIKYDIRHPLALSYSVDDSPERLCTEEPWINALYLTAKRGVYSAALQREFELHTEGNENYYAVTEKSKTEMMNEYKTTKARYRNRFASDITITLPNLEPGPKFQDNHSELQSTTSLSM